MVEFKRRATIETLVRELVVEFVDWDGFDDARHKCSPVRVAVVGPAHLRCTHASCVKVRDSRIARPACQHDHDWRLSLLDRLQRLVAEGQQVETSERPAGGGRVTGSPAPWAAAPAELIDEVMRGAIALCIEGAQVLGWSTPALAGRDRAGRDALLALPGMVIELDRLGHRLAVRSVGDRVDDGLIPDRVRAWHRRAQELTGYVVPWERVPPAPNPDFHRRVEGPACAVRKCGHGSCDRLRFRRRRYVALLCPRCDSDSLRLDPVDDVVRCIKPSCVRSSQGEWSCSRSVMEDVLRDPWGDDD